MTAPIASGWSDCRVGFAPTGKRRLCTAHTHLRHWSGFCIAGEQPTRVCLSSHQLCFGVEYLGRSIFRPLATKLIMPLNELEKAVLEQMLRQASGNLLPLLREQIE